MLAFDPPAPLGLVEVGLLDRTDDTAAAADAADDVLLLSLARKRLVTISQIDGIVVNNAMKKMRGVS